jgi:hypothetical protein
MDHRDLAHQGVGTDENGATHNVLNVFNVESTGSVGRTVTLDPAQMVAVGIYEPIRITLPPGFDAMTRAERHAWGRREIHKTIDDLLRELLR